jgi:hypothetical protein
MTYAWYGHLKDQKDRTLWLVILISWSIAFFEYCLMIPANRYAFKILSLGQMKILQEVITMTVFVVFSVLYMREKPRLDFLWAFFCLLGAVYFIFRDKPAS